jgi:hypothetical protein
MGEIFKPCIRVTNFFDLPELVAWKYRLVSGLLSKLVSGLLSKDEAKEAQLCASSMTTTPQRS